MTEGALRLLRRERDEIERVAESLREGRRIVAFLVVPPAARPTVLDQLRRTGGVTLPEPVALTDPDQTLDVLQQIDGGKPGEVRLLLLDDASPDVLRTLNWHREKLRRGASVLLWVEGVEGLRALRATAPDAYAFRDVVIAVEGEAPVPVIPPDLESVDIRLARLRHGRAVSPEERAEATITLSAELMARGSRQEARSLLDEALASIPADRFGSEGARCTRAGLFITLAGVAGSLSEAWRCRDRGLAELDGIDSAEARRRRLHLLARSRTPLGVDHHSALLALGELKPKEMYEELRPQVLRGAANSWVTYGDLTRARELLHDASSIPGLDAHERSLVVRSRCDLERAAGNLTRAEEHARSALDLARHAGTGTSYAAFSLVSCLSLRGENDAARRILTEIAAQPREVDAGQALAGHWLASILLEEGDIARALADYHALLHDAVASRDDGEIETLAFSYVGALYSAHDAGRLTPTDLRDAEFEVDVAEDVARSISGDDPPWYTVLFLSRRADLIELHPGRLADAITLMTKALDRARGLWPEAAPGRASNLVRALLKAGRHDEARAVLAIAEPEAEAAGHRRLLALLQAYSVAILVRAGEPSTAIDRGLSALRATLDPTSAPRVAADVFWELARVLPPTASHPDPLTLLDETHELYADMPIPSEQARCLESMGDVLAARGDAAARSRYLEALRMCERYGFGLRIPLLQRKIAS